MSGVGRDQCPDRRAFGSGVGALIASNLADEALRQWGWRIPFMLGGLIAVVGWYVRTGVPESPAFETIRLAGGLASSPVRDVFTTQRVAVRRWPRVAARRGVLPTVRLSDDLPRDSDDRSTRHRTRSQYWLHGAAGPVDSLDGCLVGSNRASSSADDGNHGNRALVVPVLSLAHEQ